MAAASTAGGSCLPRHAVRSSSVTLPLVRDKVGEVVLQHHAGGGGVAPVMHLTAPVNPIHGVTRAKEPTVATIALVHQWVAPGAALDHGVEVPGRSFAGVVYGDEDLVEDRVG